MKLDDLIFQILDVDHFHTEDDEGQLEFNIRMFGKTADAKSTYIEVKGFRPYFFVEIDSDWRVIQIDRIIEYIKSRIWPKTCAGGYIKYEIVQKHKFWGFTNYKLFNFIKLSFMDYESMKAYARAFSRGKHYIEFVTKRKQKIKFKVYESNINPILRFIHTMKLDPVGWCKIEGKNLVEFGEHAQVAETDYYYKADWRNVYPVDSTDIHDFIILSFDLECTSTDGGFPMAERPGDKIIQIGMTYSKCSETECFRKILLSLKNTADIEGVEVRSFNSEKNMLLEFSKLVRETDPDIITGYNIYGFDFPYLKNRAKLLNIYTQFSRLGRLKNHTCEFIEQQLSSAALGQNKLQYYKMDGRVSIDLMKVIQRDHRLTSYKLDYVSSNFIREKIKGYVNKNNRTRLYVASTFGVKKHQYISIYYNDGITDNNIGDKKYRILKLGEIAEKGGEQYIDIDDADLDIQEYLDKQFKIYWCQTKDDVSPKQIFESYEGTAAQRAIVGKYCIQDCELCNRLIGKLSILINNIGMANVCSVPLNYLFLRGQGVKIFSLVSKECRKENHLIPVIQKKYRKTEEELEKEKKENNNFEKFVNYLSAKGDNRSDDEDDDDDAGYEGATVFEPITGVHYKPIPVLDYGSLYPSSMILKNLSHESHVMDDKYDNLPGYIYHETTYKTDAGENVSCRFAENKNGTKAIIPKILQFLLDTRKLYKKKMDNETNQFKKSIYDGLQQAYKVTANSLYGQTGASTSPICKKEIAASTTATGRDMLQFAKFFIETIWAEMLQFAIAGKKKKLLKCIKTRFKDVDQKVLVSEKEGYSNIKEFSEWFYNKTRGILDGYSIEPKVIYGDTDSVFFCMNILDKKTNVYLKDKKSLEISIKLGMFASYIVNLLLPPPMVLAYEKVLWPFIILTKKRYVGNLYESDPNKFYQKCMGIVMKRRDNAPIVKIVVGGIIDKILNERDPEGAIQFTRDTLNKIITGKYGIDRFIITKTLKSFDSYKNWSSLPHAVLAHRMGVRNPGNAPQPNDRIPFCYIEVKGKVKLQGDRVEHPEYILEKDLKLDYLFYITNQIMKPSLQFLELIAHNPEDIFKEYIVKEQNRQKGVMPICAVIENYNSGDLSDTYDGYDIYDDNNFSDSDSCVKHTKKTNTVKKTKTIKSTKTIKNSKNSKNNKTVKKKIDSEQSDQVNCDDMFYF